MNAWPIPDGGSRSRARRPRVAPTPRAVASSAVVLVLMGLGLVGLPTSRSESANFFECPTCGAADLFFCGCRGGSSGGRGKCDGATDALLAALQSGRIHVEKGGRRVAADEAERFISSMGCSDARANALRFTSWGQPPPTSPRPAGPSTDPELDAANAKLQNDLKAFSTTVTRNVVTTIGGLLVGRPLSVGTKQVLRHAFAALGFEVPAPVTSALSSAKLFKFLAGIPTRVAGTYPPRSPPSAPSRPSRDFFADQGGPIPIPRFGSTAGPRRGRGLEAPTGSSLTSVSSLPRASTPPPNSPSMPEPRLGITPEDRARMFQELLEEMLADSVTNSPGSKVP